MGGDNLSMDYWRKFFRSANSDIFELIEKALVVAAKDWPAEFAHRRDRIAEIIYTCQLDHCAGCKQAKLPEDGVKESNDCDDHRGGNEPGETNTNKVSSNYSYDEAEALTAEIEEADQIVGEVKRIKEVLANQQDESDKTLFESLRRLQLMELSVETLKVTEIGKAVNNLRKHNSRQIRHMVRALIEGWKVLVDEWVKATEEIADTPPDSVNPSIVTEEDGLDFPPVDEGALFATQNTSFEFSEFFDGIDEDGNVRMPQPENSRPVRKHQAMRSGDGEQTRRQEGVTRETKSRDSVNTPPKQSNIVIKLSKTNGTDSEPRRPSRLAVMQKSNEDEKARHNHELAGGSRKSSTAVQDAQPEEMSVKAKLEIAKRRLHEGYQQAENAKKQRTIQMMELHDLPSQQQRQQHTVKSRSHVRDLLNGRRQH